MIADYKEYEKLLQQHNVRTADVVKATGLSNSTIYDWKAGRYTPKVDKLIAIAEYFDVPLEKFIKK